MLIGKNIHKKYRDLEVLRGVDIEIKKGEIVSIVGKSGTGKSTLLHILGTLDNPDIGKVIIDSQDVTELNQKELSVFRNQKIGFIFQFHHLLAEFNAIENVCIPAFINGVNKQDAYSRAKQLLDYLGLGERLEHKPSQLSGGEQQRVAVARSLINRPSIVFADEPTGNLDNETSDDLHNLFSSLKEDFDQTFVIVTHNEELASLSDRRLEMSDGLLK